MVQATIKKKNTTKPVNGEDQTIQKTQNESHNKIKIRIGTCQRN